MPATVAILAGRLRVGVSDAELAQLAARTDCRKVAYRDLPIACQGRADVWGGTTVSATMHAAHACGIRVFATGGCGGVHRDSGGFGMIHSHAAAYDVSSDLQRLAHTPVAVVCSGVKSILDIGNTLEYLETHDVPVVVYGPTDDFPGFFAARSGHRAQYHTQDLRELARIVRECR